MLPSGMHNPTPLSTLTSPDSAYEWRRDGKHVADYVTLAAFAAELTKYSLPRYALRVPLRSPSLPPRLCAKQPPNPNLNQGTLEVSSHPIDLIRSLIGSAETERLREIERVPLQIAARELLTAKH